MTELEKRLTAIATNSIAPQDLTKAFDDAAIALLRHTKLIVGDTTFLIREIEYYFSGNHYGHHDSYAHTKTLWHDTENNDSAYLFCCRG